MSKKIGQALQTAVQDGKKVEVTVGKNNFDSWNEPEPKIPDWLK